MGLEGSQEAPSKVFILQNIRTTLTDICESPAKVMLLLEELSIPYTFEDVEADKLKKEPFTRINPNGRAPAIQDPNTGITLWESAAIIQYLVEEYDKEEKLSYTKTPEKFLLNQWLAFQVSGQGPYFGQAAWFLFYHSEQLPSAKERYLKEIERVIGVLDSWLQTHEFLVGTKCTYADLSFVPYANFVSNTPALSLDGKGFKDKYPAYTAWLAKLMARPSAQKLWGPSPSH